MKTVSPSTNPELHISFAGLLTWLLPGAGHLFIGERTRGVIFMTAIAVTFWGGVAIGGVKHTVDPTDRTLWFMGQICAGGHTLAVLAWSKMIDIPEAYQDRPDQYLRAYGRAEEISVVYTAICGMLNILIIFDVLVRSERQLAVLPQRGPPPRTRRKPR